MKRIAFFSIALMFVMIGLLTLTAFAAAGHDHKDGDVNDPCLGTVDKADLEKEEKQ